VIHLDTGWFETELAVRLSILEVPLPNPKQMIADLREQGFRISCGSFPTSRRRTGFFPEMIEKGLCRTRAGWRTAWPGCCHRLQQSCRREVVSGPATRVEIGVAAIKVDFGEGAPLNGAYASGKSGFHEHNLYPLRYKQGRRGDHA